MAATGELIRLTNYVDDITNTLRRISASIPMMDPEERKKLADYMRSVSPNFSSVLTQLEKGGQ
jgi:chromosome segregation ATPase